MINFYYFRDELKRSILERQDKIDILRHPTDWGWIAYALSQDGKRNNPLFNNTLDMLEKWALSEEAGKQERHLGPLSICSYLTNKKKVHSKIMGKITVVLNELLAKEITKFSPLNDPEQVFCIVLNSKHIPETQKNKLREVILKGNQGRLLRRALYTASLIELGDKIREWPTLEGVEGGETPEDIITLLWLYERYRDKCKYKLAPIWESFKSIKASINLGIPNEEESSIVISNRSVALLYEAVVIESQAPDPNMLFDIYPLHKRVRQIAEKHFKEKSYVVAVEQATKVLNEFIQEKSGIKSKGEAELVQSTMKISKSQSPKIKFNKYLNENSGKNEQSGLAMVTEGIFRAFRNPKGHKPENHPLIKIDAYEALNQLIIISYIMKRIEEAVYLED